MRLSVIVPLLNEQDNLRELHTRLQQALDPLGCDRQLIFVDDGSTDRSAEVLREMAAADSTVRALRLSRNFGHEAATTAGLDQADGDAVVVMDADLQDPPEMIPQMIQRWRAGAEVVYAVRTQRRGERWPKRMTAWLFYRILNWLTDVEIPADTGDFRLIDAKVLRALQQCREQDRFVRGLVAWAGFKAEPLPYDRPQRHAGTTKYNPSRLLLLSLDAAVGFSILPLRIATAIGFVVTGFSMLMALIIMIQRLFFPSVIQQSGYALLTSGLFFLGGVQMLLLGILGEYVGRIYRQGQGRPLYLVRETIGAPADA